MLSRHSKTRLVLALLLGLVAVPTLRACATEEPPTAAEIVRRMLESQSGLADFTATVTLETKVAGIPLPTVTGRLYSKRPNKVKVQIGGMSLLPRHPFLFPDPLEFTTGKYALTLAGHEILGQDVTWIVDVVPSDPQAERLQMRFWISEASWLIVQADMSLPKAGRTRLRARYVKGAAEHAWVPAELSGEGGLLLFDLLPALGLGPLLASLDLAEKIVFQATLSGHQVNTGLSDSVFSP